MNNGRIKIICDLIPTGDVEKDKIIIPKIIDATLPLHQKNVSDMKRLKDYYYNNTDVRFKTKTQQPLINNKIAIDYAYIATTTINGYCFSNSLTFSSRQVGNEDKMKALLDSMDDDNYDDKLLRVALNSSIGGLAYKYIEAGSEEDNENGIWYKTSTDIDPETTYCVYSNSLLQEKICAISFFDRKVYSGVDFSTVRNEKVYQVWTKYHQWEFVRNKGKWENTKFDADPELGTYFEAYPNTCGKIPIIEYVRQQDRTGDFELAIDLINAINTIASSRVDDVQQSVDYVITLRDIDTDSEGALSRIQACLKQGILSFRSIPEAIVQPEINVLDTKLNQSEVQTLQQFLCDKLEEVLNIPNRESRSAGGDTGRAVESRNGFRSLENKASLVVTSMIKGENEALDVILAICDNIRNCPLAGLKTKDVDIRDNRNKYENLSTAADAYATFKAAGMNDETALETVRAVNDAITVSKKNKNEFEETERLKIELEVEKAKRLADVEIEKSRTLAQISQVNSDDPNTENGSNGDDSNTKNESKNGSNTDE